MKSNLSGNSGWKRIALAIVVAGTLVVIASWTAETSLFDSPPTEVLPTTSATQAGPATTTTTGYLNTSGSGTGIVIQEFAVPDKDSHLNLDIEITTRDTDQDGDAIVRPTTDSDYGHHTMFAVLRDGALGVHTLGSGSADAGGVYATATGNEAGAGIDGLGIVEVTEWRDVSSSGADLELVLLYVRSTVEIRTEIEWSGEVGTAGATTQGNDSVVSFDVDDLHTGVGIDARPGPSAALGGTSVLQADDLLGYFDPSQGPGVVTYSYRGPSGTGEQGTLVGSSDERFILNSDRPSSWQFQLQGVIASESDPHPVVLAGDLSGGITEVE
jgi:hypothetical protein